MISIVGGVACAFIEWRWKRMRAEMVLWMCWRTVIPVWTCSLIANDIDHARLIGLPYTDKNSGKKVKSIIVKFRSWKARQRFYKGRPRHYADSSKKPGFTVSVDLTKRRYLLLTKAKGLIKGNSNIKYVYSDINCSLALRFNDDSFKVFNSERELLSLLNV